MPQLSINSTHYWHLCVWMTLKSSNSFCVSFAIPSPYLLPYGVYSEFIFQELMTLSSWSCSTFGLYCLHCCHRWIYQNCLIKYYSHLLSRGSFGTLQLFPGLFRWRGLGSPTPCYYEGVPIATPFTPLPLIPLNRNSYHLAIRVMDHANTRMFEAHAENAM